MSSDVDGPHPLVITLANRIGSKEKTKFNGDLGLWQLIETQQEQIDKLEEKVNELSNELEELSAGLENDSYDNLTREQKRLRVKRFLDDKARQNNGKGAVKYGEIRALFENKIPSGSAVKLMRSIGEESSGYFYDERDNKPNLLKTDLREREDLTFTREQQGND